MNEEKGRLYKLIEGRSKEPFPQNTFSYDLGVADAYKFMLEHLDKANSDFPEANDAQFRVCSGETQVFDWSKYLMAVKEWRKKWFGNVE